jgi:hypothetical protein
VAKVYVNRLELSVAENLLASADGTIGASNDSCLQLKHSSSGSAPGKLRDYRRWRRGQRGAHSGRTRSGAN